MDPFTLFALANGAVSAVKAGCKLYKDIKSAAGDVKDVLKDLDDQFAKIHKDKPPTVEQKNDLIRKKNEVRELNKKANEGGHTNVYQEIGDYLGQYYDNYYKCIAIFEEEEKRSHEEIYTGDASLGKRALQRVLMRKQLEQMGVELREVMTYQAPPELGALYTEVNEMMKRMGAEQKVLITKQMKREAQLEKRRKEKTKQLMENMLIGIGGTVAACSIGLMFSFIVQDRIQKYPQYGTGWIPKTEEQRRKESEPQIYIGR